MFLENAGLVVAGLACMGLSGAVLYTAMPRAGRPVSFLTKTELRSTMLALGLVTSIVVGGGLVLKGLLA